jgi:2-aminoadipate transaminase
MKRSAVRELLKLTRQPDMISFAGGLPAPELFPLEQIRDAANNVIRRNGAQALQYGETEGLAELRDWIAARFTTPSMALTRSNVVITSGAQQALDLIGRVLLDPGDRVVAENPTYLALLSAWRPLGVEFLPVAADAEGADPDHLEMLLERGPKAAYLIPNFQNPTGATLSLPRRHAIVRSLRRAGVVVVEDDPYGELRYEGGSLPSLFSLDAEGSSNGGGNVVYVGTFSKVLAPGLRLGWAVGPETVIDKMVQAKQATDLHTSTFNQQIAWELIRAGFLTQHLPVLREEYRQRRNAMLTALDEALPLGATWTRPDGGMFLMVRLPDGLDSKELLKQAIELKVAFVPGSEFYIDQSGDDTLRLNFTGVNSKQISEGIYRLGTALAGICPVA